MTILRPKKLIEVALPLRVINEESLLRKQKAPKGWPTSFHKWWAQRPLAASRAVLFGQLVNDPSWRWEMESPGLVPPSHLKASWAAKRKRLFQLIEKLVLWENSRNERLLNEAWSEIKRSWVETCEINASHPDASVLFDPDTIPPVLDPFAGSGTIPLEAQRLGLRTFASDLNPVAVAINKALIEAPWSFVAQTGERGLGLSDCSSSMKAMSDDIRRYSRLLRSRTEAKIGHLYPGYKVTPETAQGRADLSPLIGQTLNPIAWIWARTVRSPNPAFRHVHVPLISSYILSSKPGKEAYLRPIVDGDSYRFEIIRGVPPSSASGGTSAGKRQAFRCLLSDAPIDYPYIRAQGKAGGMGQRLLAIVVEGQRGRLFLPPEQWAEASGLIAAPESFLSIEFPKGHRDFKPPIYGMEKLEDIFTPRQLTGLGAFCDGVAEIREIAIKDAVERGLCDDGRSLEDGGTGATAYGDAMALYLACIIDRMVYYGSSLTTWLPKDNALRDCMPRQALAMTWDFAEANPFGKSSGDIDTCTNAIANYVEIATPRSSAVVMQEDARTISAQVKNYILCTDPPYYDNINYAELSDYFYPWMRKSLRSVFPRLFATMATPKSTELVASSHRHGDEAAAEIYFLTGMTEAMKQLAEGAHPALPITIFYAFKQSETESEEGTSSTGWETFLQAVIDAGLEVTGTLPMRTEGASRMIARGNNALASSIVLVCRPRPQDAVSVSRRSFIRELNTVLPESLDEMTRGTEGESPVAPVDLSQAIIGPGMAIFTKHASVLEADGSRMSVKTALQLINRFLAEDDFDHDTQFCLHWFSQHGWTTGKFGDADQLARAKGTAVNGVQQAGVIDASGGLVRLRKWSEYSAHWDPATDQRLPIWEVLHRTIRIFREDGEFGAARILAVVGSKAEAARQLAYRLYTLCERAGWSEDARAYNEIVTSWSAIEAAAANSAGPRQAALFDA